jgi:hypothetical protein
MDRLAGPYHKRNKSSTSVLKAIMTTKNQQKASATPKGKENTTPPGSSTTDRAVETPIWSQFATTPMQQSNGQVTITTKIPLNDRTSEQDAARHMPQAHSPSKHRAAEPRPTLGRRERPKSEVLPKSASSISIFDALQRTNNAAASGPKLDELTFRGSPTKTTRSAPRELLTMAKKGSKVMSLVAAFNGKSNEETTVEKLDPKQIDAAFEDVLVSWFFLPTSSPAF